jgi:hypothetical protein
MSQLPDDVRRARERASTESYRDRKRCSSIWISLEVKARAITRNVPSTGSAASCRVG